jgi:hypothetical protein
MGDATNSFDIGIIRMRGESIVQSTQQQPRKRRNRSQYQRNSRGQGSTTKPLHGGESGARELVVRCLAQVRLVLLMCIPLDEKLIPHDSTCHPCS